MFDWVSFKSALMPSYLNQAVLQRHLLAGPQTSSELCVTTRGREQWQHSFSINYVPHFVDMKQRLRQFSSFMHSCSQVDPSGGWTRRRFWVWVKDWRWSQSESQSAPLFHDLWAGPSRSTSCSMSPDLTFETTFTQNWRGKRPLTPFNDFFSFKDSTKATWWWYSGSKLSFVETKKTPRWRTNMQKRKTEVDSGGSSPLRTKGCVLEF